MEKLILGFFFLSLYLGSMLPALGGVCDPLEWEPGPTETISSPATLIDRAYNAPAGTTLLLEANTYHLDTVLHIQNNGIILRSASGNREDVVLDFGGMSGGAFGIQVYGDEVVIADLTIQNARDHGVSIQGVDSPVLYNLHIVDIGDQLVKVNPVGDGSEDGLLACSLLEYSSTAPDNYTNGISAHNAQRWVVRDNTWRRIRPSDGHTPLPTILFWSGSTDTIVERNLLVDCIQGISFGNASHGAGDHLGGIVRNNVIYATMGHDVAIEMVHATGWLVAHNTVILQNPIGGLTWGMEARFSSTSGTFVNNLTNMSIWANRDGALGATTDNNTEAQLSWFVSPTEEDFHLVGSASAVLNQGSQVVGVETDMDNQPRGSQVDLGADELGLGVADVIRMLQLLTASPLSSSYSDISGDDRIGLAELQSLLHLLANE